jgi:hypothetical protein
MSERISTVAYQDDHVRLTVFASSFDAEDHVLEQFDGFDARGLKRWIRVQEYAPRGGREAGQRHLAHTQQLLAQLALALAELAGWTRTVSEGTGVTWARTVFPTT